MTPPVGDDESAHPADVGFLGPLRHAPPPDACAKLVEQSWRRCCCAAAAARIDCRIGLRVVCFGHVRASRKRIHRLFTGITRHHQPTPMIPVGKIRTKATTAGITRRRYTSLLTSTSS